METESKTHVTGKEGGLIKLDVAASWTKNYREKHPGQTISHLFGKELLENILNQEGCAGIRFYYAYDHDGKKHLVLTGVKSNGTDQTGEEYCDSTGVPLPPEGLAKVGVTAPVLNTNGVGDQSVPCPGSPGCPKGLLSGTSLS
jgi:hypothetical protein